MAVLKRTRIGGVLLATGLWLSLSAGAEGAPTALEAAVKANYLYKFAPFVTWPAAAFTAPTSPFSICLTGEDPFGRVLDDAVQGQSIDEHPIAVRRLGASESIAGCHVLFAGASPTQSPADALRAVAGTPVLTVTDQNLGGSGGMIQFVLQGGKVRFSIDAGAAEANGVQISSKLLQLAVSVRKAAK